MNRFKKEKIKRHHEERKSLAPEQIKALDLQEIENAEIQKLAQKIHTERFPEEYDFMYDDHTDVADRKKRKNPMSDEYIAKISEKRKTLGVSQLSENGMPESNDTWELCFQEAKKDIRDLRTRINEIMYYKWDPLHISNSNWTRDEYNSYVPEVFRLSLESPSYQPISDYLTHVTTEIMSMTENVEHDIEIAELIFSLAKDHAHFPDHTLLEVE
jgi:hypothetical protein